jgi:hypothetical protein
LQSHEAGEVKHRQSDCNGEQNGVDLSEHAVQALFELDRPVMS